MRLLSYLACHAEETIVRDITLITAASKDLEAARYVQGIFSNSYFRLYTNSDVIALKWLVLLNIIAVGAGAPRYGLWGQCQGSRYSWTCGNYSSWCETWG